MSRSARMCLLGLLSLLTVAQIGCNAGPQRLLQQSQLRMQQLYAQNKALATQQAGLNQSAAALAAERQRLEQEKLALQKNLDVANQRLTNLSSSNQQLEQRYRNLLASAKNQPNPMSSETNRRLEDLKRRYPDFDFDPQTGVSKFSTDLAFASGSDQINPKFKDALREFAQIMNQGDARQLHILVVGHTDDKPIAKKETAQRHPTNWHLSTNRANAVVIELAKAGIAENRMGSTGYGPYQPLVPNSDDANRAKNRRVEIFVLAPDAAVAGWDPSPVR